MSALKSAIDAADVDRVKHTLERDRDAADRPIVWSDRFGPFGTLVCPNRCVPLHYLCDRVFAKKLSDETALDMAQALIAAGAAINPRHPKSGDIPLIAAASLGATSVGLALIAAGGDVHARGLFGASALHWAAMLGDPSLTAALIAAGAPVDEPDTQYQSPPLGWAMHALKSPPKGELGEQHACIAALVRAGAVPHPDWLAAAEADPALLVALSGEGA